MSISRAAEDASVWWTGRSNQNPSAEIQAVELTAAVVPPYHQQNDQIPFSRPRLRWSKDLHEKFVSAINELGGANEATPKKILKLMQVEGVTLFNIKSHLQKYRDGKTPKRLLTRDAVPPDGQRITEDDIQDEPMDVEVHQGSSDTTNGDKTVETKKRGNVNHLAETGVVMENHPSLIDVELEKHISPIPASGNHDDLHHFPEWSELIDADEMKPISLHLNSLGYSSDFIFTSTNNISSPSMTFGNFFDDVERFPKIEDHLMIDDDVYLRGGI